MLIISVLLINKINTYIILFIWEILLISQLISISKSKYSWFLLIHPLFLICTMGGFEIPFTQIGSGYSFLGKFNYFFETDAAATSGTDYTQVFLTGNIFETYIGIHYCLPD